MQATPSGLDKRSSDLELFCPREQKQEVVKESEIDKRFAFRLSPKSLILYRSQRKFTLQNWGGRGVRMGYRHSFQVQVKTKA